MKVYCERNCERKSKGICQLERISILKEGCKNFLAKPEFEPLREDNVVIFDNAGLPSIMVRFTRPESEKIHPMFIIGGEVYDEIYISKYQNCIIDGKAYSLPMQEPATNVDLEAAEKACFSKGEGWHLLTAAERGFLALDSYERGTLPHGNTSCGKYHGNPEEHGKCYDGYRTYTGSGPVTWTHDHTVFGVHDLCGNIWEWFRGMRLVDGELQIVNNNDAAMNIDLTEDSLNWIPVVLGEEKVFLNVEGGIVRFTTEEPDDCDYTGCEWEDAEFDFEIPDTLRNLGLFNGEDKAYIYADTERERLPICGGSWDDASSAGVFSVHPGTPRSASSNGVGFRSAYYCKRKPVAL